MRILFHRIRDFVERLISGRSLSTEPRKTELLVGLERLPARQRDVYLVCAVEGRSFSTAAIEFGISVVEIETLPAAALAALAADLALVDVDAVASSRTSD